MRLTGRRSRRTTGVAGKRFPLSGDVTAGTSLFTKPIAKDTIARALDPRERGTARSEKNGQPNSSVTGLPKPSLVT